MNKNKGFTLIELLVVIAIIGILSSVVLASLSGARTKAKVAAVQSTLSSMRAQAEMGVVNGKYIADICNSTANGGLKTLLLSLATTKNSKISYLACGVDVANTTDLSRKWAVEVGINDGSSDKYYCADSTGYSGLSKVSGGTDGAGKTISTTAGETLTNGVFSTSTKTSVADLKCAD